MAQAKKPVTDLVALSPKMREMLAFATELSNSGIVPMAYIGRPSAVFAAIQYGREFKLPPMSALQNIAVINGKPTLGTDLMVSLAMKHPEWAGYEILKSDETEASVVVYRYSEKLERIMKYTSSFTVKDAEKAGLLRPNSPWEKWRKRMLKHRAMAFAIRDAFPDVLSGTYAYEEMDPDFGADEEMRKAEEDDLIHANILDEKGVPVEPVEGKVERTKEVPKAKETKKSSPKIAPKQAAKGKGR